MKSEKQKAQDKAEICKKVKDLRLERNKEITIKETELRILKMQLNADTNYLIEKECEKLGISVKLIRNILNS